MKTLLLLLCALLSSCASLNGQNTLTPQGEQAILALIQIATGVAVGTTTGAAGTCAALGQITPTSPGCVPSTTQDPAAVQAALQACTLWAVETATIFRIQAKLCGAPTAVTK